MTRPAPLYMRVTGDSWPRLAEPLRCLHASAPIARARGRLRIEHGAHPVARLIARALRLPRPAVAAETQLTISARPGCDHWVRTFDGTRLETTQCESDAGLLAERFGILEFRFRLQASRGGLLYIQQEAAFVCSRLRLLLPAAGAPRIHAREDPAGPNRIQVDVRVTVPGIGPLISYEGIFDLEETQP